MPPGRIERLSQETPPIGIDELVVGGARPAPRLHRRQRQVTTTNQRGRACHRRGDCNDVLQLPNVPRPIVLEEGALSRRRKTLPRPRAKKLLRQGQDIPRPPSQWPWKKNPTYGIFRREKGATALPGIGFRQNQ